MAMTGPDEFRQRAGRAYEWGRLRHAAAKAWLALPLTAISCGLCHEPRLSVSIGMGLFALVTSLVWYGRIATQAASAGLKAGIVAFIVPVVGFQLCSTPYCTTFAAVLIIDGGCGLGVGIWLSVESARLQTHRDVFLLLASVVATLCGMLGCMLFGPIGLAGMAAGILLSTVPITIYRRAITTSA